jgi:hypothetical protein
MNKSINIFLIVLFYLISCENVYSQEDVFDTVYVTAEKFSMENEMRKKARIDIANGNVYLKIYGLVILTIDNGELDSLTHKYGFEYKLEGCMIPLGAEAYVDEVMLFLNKRNGAGWWEKFIVEESKLENLPIPALPQKEEN